MQLCIYLFCNEALAGAVFIIHTFIMIFLMLLNSMLILITYLVDIAITCLFPFVYTWTLALPPYDSGFVS